MSQWGPTREALLNVETLVFVGAAVHVGWRDRQRLRWYGDRWGTVLGFGLLGWVLGPAVPLGGRHLGGDDAGGSRPDLVFAGFRHSGTTATLARFAVSGTGGFALIRGYVTLVDAQFAHYLLWSLGFDAVRQGSEVRLPGGAIDIYEDCSSFAVVYLLLRLTLVLILLFPLSRRWQGGLVLAAIALGVFFNGIRMVLLALLLANGQDEAFRFWHGPGAPGNQIFSTLTIVAFGLLANLGLEEPTAPQD